ncbi:MAG: hypothetical protein M0017_10115 [Desulfobacteraceae bacterium]|nr:hypothetical protein [Desulfobacteraceae bacterium]
MDRRQKPAAGKGTRYGPLARRPPWAGLILFAVAWIGFLRAIGLLSPAGGTASVPYAVFKEQLRRGNVAEITIAGRGIQGIFHRPVATGRPGERTAGEPVTRFGTTLPPCGDGELVTLLTARKVMVRAEPPEDG